MHYEINGVLIKTENAAKPVSQQNRNVLEWIKSLPFNSRVLDYGCGKLRYTIPLSETVKNVWAVDSIYQIQRIQTINKINTSLKDYAKEYLKNVTIEEVYSDNWKNNNYDYILCSNVLSSVPLIEERIEILKNLKKSKNNSGIIFLSTQYRNSYFKTYAYKYNSSKFNDGWIITNKNSKTFYGLIPLKSLIELCENVGLKIIQGYNRDGSAYILAN